MALQQSDSPWGLWAAQVDEPWDSQEQALGICGTEQDTLQAVYGHKASPQGDVWEPGLGSIPVLGSSMY